MHKELFARIVLFVVVTHIHLHFVPETMTLEIMLKLLSWSIWILLPVPVVQIEISQMTLMSSAPPCLQLIANWFEELKKVVVVPTELKMIQIFFILRFDETLISLFFFYLFSS